MSPRSRPTKANTAGSVSTFSRLIKFCLSLYLLAAIFYTAYHFFFAPVVQLVAGKVPDPTELNHANLIIPQEAGSITLGVKSQPAVIPKAAQRHPALETAGVKAADIRDEEAGDHVWAAAEAAELKKGKKKGKEESLPYVRPVVLKDGRDLVRKRLHGLDGVEWDMDMMNWYHPSSSKPSDTKGSSASTHEFEATESTAISEDQFLSLSFSTSLQPSKVIPYYYRASAPDEPDFNEEDITITTLVTGNRFTVFERLVERYRGNSVAIYFTWT